MIDKKALELYELIVALHEGDLTAEQFQHLNARLKDKDEVRRYTEFISIFSGLSCPSTADIYIEENERASAGELEQDSYTNIMMKFAQEEHTAPAVAIVPPEPRPEPLGMLKREKITYSVNRLSVLTIIASAAVILIVILFAKLAPRPSGYEVATLAETLNTEWGNAAIERGTRFSSQSESMQLRRGIAELLFDTGVKVVVEAPAEFMILSDHQIKLFYGQAFASVPSEAIGFSVQTLNSKIIDLGTEFGIRAEVDGSSQVHVIKGKVHLTAGSKSEQFSCEILGGQAKRVFGFSSQVADIACDDTLFVREIEPESQTVWRGQKTFDLADAASGGNGFGTALPEMGIDLKTGKLQAGRSERRGSDSKGYLTVDELAFVDGVFIPNAAQGPVQITSQGHRYGDFTRSNGLYYMTVGNHHVTNMDFSGQWKQNISLVPGGVSAENTSILCLHASAGITFDLENIRGTMPWVNVRRFSAVYGIANTRKEQDKRPIISDFYVFVDGQPRFVKKDVSITDGSSVISIELGPHERFLTLVCMEGSDNFGDWTVFVNPVLEIESQE